MDNQKSKVKLLVMTSTFPKWKNDAVPPFVYILSKHLSQYFDVHVLAPYSKGCKVEEWMDNIYVNRFKYWCDKENNLAEGAILPNLKKNKLLWIQVPFFVLFEFISLIKPYGLKELVRSGKVALARAIR